MEQDEPLMALRDNDQINMVYFFGVPVFIGLMVAHFYYCWRSVRECRRSSVREANLNKPLLADALEAVLEVGGGALLDVIHT